MLVSTSPFEFFAELATDHSVGAQALHRESVQADLFELIDEAYVTGILSDVLSLDPGELAIEVVPLWREEPCARGVEIKITQRGPEARTYTQRFETGPWMRRATVTADRLRTEGSVPLDATVYVHFLAERNGTCPELSLPQLQAPTVTEQSLEELEVRELGDGELCPDRPILVNERMVEEILVHTEQAGPHETGGGTLGKMVRLGEPLPGARSRIVTVLTASLPDSRHLGEPARFTFDPGALQEAAQIADARGLGEVILTAFHSHGWGTDCGRCNESADCALPQATLVSLDDYRVMESLFPSKATLMPIAGRKLGAPGKRPVLEIHAWRGGRMTPVPWRLYRD